MLLTNETGLESRWYIRILEIAEIEYPSPTRERNESGLGRNRDTHKATPHRMHSPTNIARGTKGVGRETKIAR